MHTAHSIEVLLGFMFSLLRFKKRPFGQISLVPPLVWFVTSCTYNFAAHHIVSNKICNTLFFWWQCGFLAIWGKWIKLPLKCFNALIVVGKMAKEGNYTLSPLNWVGFTTSWNKYLFWVRVTLFALHGLLKAQIPVWPAGVANFKTPPHTN